MHRLDDEVYESVVTRLLRKHTIAKRTAIRITEMTNSLNEQRIPPNLSIERTNERTNQSEGANDRTRPENLVIYKRPWVEVKSNPNGTDMLRLEQPQHELTNQRTNAAMLTHVTMSRRSSRCSLVSKWERSQKLTVSKSEKDRVTRYIGTQELPCISCVQLMLQCYWKVYHQSDDYFTQYISHPFKPEALQRSPHVTLPCRVATGQCGFFIIYVESTNLFFRIPIFDFALHHLSILQKFRLFASKHCKTRRSASHDQCASWYSCSLT